LQKFIFNRYIEWVQKKSEGEVKVLNIVNGNTVQQYEQMIEAMLEFNKNCGTKDKNMDFMTKLLSQIQKLKKIITPSKCF
jgi:flavorubredoxin